MANKVKPKQLSRPRRDVILNFPVEEEGRLLLEYVTSKMPQATRTTLKSYLRHNQIAIDGVPCNQFDHELAAGSLVQVNTTREFQVLNNRRLQIVHEDNDVIVAIKGYGLLSIGTDRKKDQTAYSILREYVKWKDPSNKIFIVHRLDQHTSGLMMFARNMESKERMQHNWNNMVLERTYYCVVEGKVEENDGIIRSYLAENTQHDTGRKNQIRVHMKEMGHPIAGDRKYGAKTSPIHRLALHAGTLRFVHPITRRDMNFKTQIPSGFMKMVN